jgi:hypothetical protein
MVVEVEEVLDLLELMGDQIQMVKVEQEDQV